ncbi:sugar ABC transporter permease [Paenibacillus piri]|uniref:Sugar ABC transporter permease n=2 Tax=Paenibacillus piri TaxID=2547395 RepID=A0A4R5KYE3_9BACL|nr:sugar ABC transporter permease [Paenibacillus piri]
MRNVSMHKFIYLLVLPGLFQIIVFDYVPFYYLQVAFKKFNVFKGLEHSPWIGFQNFIDLFNSEYFVQAFKNTVIISLMQLLIGFFVPVVIAIMLNELRSRKFARVVQTTIYLPHFLSWVIIGGLFVTLLSPNGGVVNILLSWVGFEPIYFMASPGWFRWVLVFSEIWKNAGWESIIYLAAIVGIGQDQYESAIVDGASRFQRMVYITFPALIPTMLVVLLLKISNILRIFEQVFVMYNPVVSEISETLGTYVYQIGIRKGDLAFATAAGLFNSLVSLVLVLAANYIVKKIRGQSIV